MTRYVALLGAINVGGNRLSMADLREALEREDFEEVETVVASGNVLFEHEQRPSEGLAEKLAWVVRDRFDIDTFAVVMTREELAAAIAENPFADDGEEKFVHTLFCDGQPGENQVRGLILDHEGRGPERIAPEWWRKDTLWATGARDYFDVEEEGGRRFWIYRDNATGPVQDQRWYLHGLF